MSNKQPHFLIGIYGASLSVRHYGYREAKFISFSEPPKDIME